MNKITSERLAELIAWDQKICVDPRPGEFVFDHMVALRELRTYRNEGLVLVPRNTLVHWMEYWNGSRNERAMFDALNHIMDEINAVLNAPEPQEGP